MTIFAFHASCKSTKTTKTVKRPRLTNENLQYKCLDTQRAKIESIHIQNITTIYISAELN